MFYSDSAVMNTPQACIIDLTPPTFAGVAAATLLVGGSISLSWIAAVELESPPVEYDVFILKGTGVLAAALFQNANIVFSTKNLSARIFHDALGVLLQPGETYFMGVRARNSVGISETNTAMQSLISSGVLEDDCATLGQKIQSLINTVRGDLEGTVSDVNELVAEIDDENELEATVEDC